MIKKEGATLRLIVADGIAVKRGTKYILKNINWNIEQGDRWILFGLNGCGKTTLLSILAGYQTSSEGTLTLFGNKPTAETIIPLRKKIGWVSASFFEQYLKYETIMDIVLAGKQGTLGISDEDITDCDIRKAKRYLIELGLQNHMRYTYNLLSRGQKQKVLLARAMMSEKEILILDEPCSGLDILSKAKVLYELEKMIHQQNKTVIYVTHHTDEILPCFNKAMLLKEGKIHSQGDIQQVFNQENFTDFFNIPTIVNYVGNQFSINLHMEGIAIDGGKETLT